MDLHLRVRKNRLAPPSKHLTCLLHLVEEDVVRIYMVHLLVPCTLDDLLESGHLYPKVFEAERLGPRWPFVIGKEERAVVGERRRESM